MLRLIDLEAPLDDVEFPDGSVHKPVPFGPTEYRLWREMQKEKDETAVGRIAMQILRACYPTATDENFDTCTSTMGLALIAHASRKIDQVRAALKNVGASAASPASPPTPAEDTAPSSLRTSGTTSSRNTRKRSGKTRGESTGASHTDDQSSSGTGIITSSSTSGSQNYAASWTTSTEPVSAPTP